VYGNRNLSHNRSYRAPRVF